MKILIAQLKDLCIGPPRIAVREANSKPDAWRASIPDSGVAIADAARHEALAKLAN
jgi:hypothetical protein